MAVVNLTGLVGKDVYTRNAKYVGKVEDTLLETEKGAVYGFAVAMARDSFLYKVLSTGEQGAKKTILIPYREVIAADDILIVTVPKQYEKSEGELAATEEEEEPPIPGLGEGPVTAF